jgi:transcriptional regulator with XRE-family HTH domain
MEIDKMRLRELRADQALSIRELAALAGVSHQTVWHLERDGGNAQPRTIRKLSQALGVKPRFLMGKDDA